MIRLREATGGLVLGVTGIVLAALLAVGGCSSRPEGAGSRLSAAESAAVAETVSSSQCAKLLSSFAGAQLGSAQLAAHPDPSRTVPVYVIAPAFLAGDDAVADLGRFSYFAVPVRFDDRDALDTLEITVRPDGSQVPDAVASGNQEGEMATHLGPGDRLLLDHRTNTWFAWTATGAQAIASQLRRDLIGKPLTPSELRVQLTD